MNTPLAFVDDPTVTPCETCGERSLHTHEFVGRGTGFGCSLQDRRQQRKSLNRISRDLWDEFGIDVTGQTLKNWCDELGIEKPERVA